MITLPAFTHTRAPAKPVSAQTNADGSIHRWYRMRLGFSDHLVSSLIASFNLHPTGGCVLDPFCGAGTTLVECKKRGISSVGVDANPASVFASSVKTNWDLERTRLRSLLDELEEICHAKSWSYTALAGDSTYQYLDRTGLIRRGWICVEPLLEAIAVKQTIAGLATRTAYKNFFTLALLTEIVEEASNVRFGPELYCGPKKKTSDVFDGFVERADNMIDDAQSINAIPRSEARVIQGDSRNLAELLSNHETDSIAAIICSPPYPAEHDYTRNTRLELAFLDKVHDRESLRVIKRAMVRCHTKGIYKSDDDGEAVKDLASIQKITNEIGQKAQSKKHGFARLYVKVIQEYFGGMLMHFKSAGQVLKSGAMCAYVVGDQSAYLQVHIPTASLLAELAQQVGFDCLGIKRWRTRRASTTNKSLNENILLMRKR